jgi:hypothetical protein
VKDPVSSDKQRQLQRVLERVQQLPIIPPGSLPASRAPDVHLASLRRLPSASPARPALAMAVHRTTRRKLSGPRSWLLALIPVGSATVAAAIAAAITLFVVHWEHPAVRNEVDQPVARSVVPAPVPTWPRQAAREPAPTHEAPSRAAPERTAKIEPGVRDDVPAVRYPEYRPWPREPRGMQAPAPAGSGAEPVPPVAALQPQDQQNPRPDNAPVTRNGRPATSTTLERRRHLHRARRQVATAAQEPAAGGPGPAPQARTAGVGDVLAGGL